MRNVLLAAGVAAALLLAGCSSSASSPPSSAGPTSTTTSVLAFGQSYSWPDGLTVEVDAPQPTTMPPLSSLADTHAPDTAAMTLHVVVKAPSGTSINPPSDVRIDLTAGDDVAHEYQLGAVQGFYVGGPLAPGQQRAYTLAYTVAKPETSWQASVASGFSHPPAFFR
jgi:hypothetical protein